MFQLFSTMMCVNVNVYVHPSSHSCPMDISAPDWSWGNTCAVLSPVDNRGLRFIYSLWVAYMKIPSVRST